MSDPEGRLPEDIVLEQAEALARQLFGSDMDLDQPILGWTNEDIVAPNVHEMLRDPRNTLATLVEDSGLIGFSIAVPIGVMDATREAESEETAYIYFTGIQPHRQGEGLVKSLIEDLQRKLVARGYRFMERDCQVTNGYADKVQKAYDAIPGAIVGKPYNHARFGPEVGEERFFRIDLSKATT